MTTKQIVKAIKTVKTYIDLDAIQAALYAQGDALSETECVRRLDEMRSGKVKPMTSTEFDRRVNAFVEQIRDKKFRVDGAWAPCTREELEAGLQRAIESLDRGEGISFEDFKIKMREHIEKARAQIKAKKKSKQQP